jgi:hypothetical protein
LDATEVLERLGELPLEEQHLAVQERLLAVLAVVARGELVQVRLQLRKRVRLRHGIEEAPAAERWSALSVSDASWPHARGAWRTLAEAPYAERREVDVLFDEPCPARAR